MNATLATVNQSSLGLNSPVQSECVQEGRQTLHNEKNGHSENSKEKKDEGQQDEASEASRRKANAHHHRPQHLRQLCGGPHISRWQRVTFTLTVASSAVGEPYVREPN